MATTYYISWSTGSDSNNGTSKASPWKTHPYMANSTVSGYTHANGDKFVFKMGDSWGNACFGLTTANGGVAGNPDVFTYDPTWGTNPGYVGNAGQTVGAYQFSAGGTTISGSFNWFINASGNNYVTFNGIEFTGMTWTGAPSYGNATGVYLGSIDNVIVSNCYFHGWTHAGATVDAFNGVLGSGGAPYNVGCRVTGCVFDGANSGGAGVADSGEATYCVPLNDNNIVKNMTNGFRSNLNSVIYNNVIGPINTSFDTITIHENGIEPIVMVNGVTGTNYIFNNIVHDCVAVAILTQGSAASTGVEINYVWNNVLYVGSTPSPPIPLQFDSVSTSNSSCQNYAWNNTIYGGSGSCIRAHSRGNGNFGVLDLRNNHCITDSGTPINLEITGNTYTSIDNLTQSTSAASAQGYTLGETYVYSPTTGTSATVGQGSNLTSFASGQVASLASDTTYGGARVTITRPGSGAWDVGAYEFPGGVIAAVDLIHLGLGI